MYVGVKTALIEGNERGGVLLTLAAARLIMPKARITGMSPNLRVHLRQCEA